VIGLAAFEGFKFFMDYGRITDFMIYEREGKSIEKLREEFDEVEMYLPNNDEYPLHFFHISDGLICNLIKSGNVDPLQAQVDMKVIKFRHCEETTDRYYKIYTTYSDIKKDLEFEGS